MATKHFKDGAFEMTIITHGKPDPHLAAQAILPLVMEALGREWSQKRNDQNKLTVKQLIQN